MSIAKRSRKYFISDHWRVPVDNYCFSPCHIAADEIHTWQWYVLEIKESAIKCQALNKGLPSLVMVKVQARDDFILWSAKN